MSSLLHLFLILVFSLPVFGLNCPNKDNAPLCPDSGSTILDDTYPTQAFVVSVNGYHTRSSFSGEPASKLPADFISTILQSYTKDSPQILVPSNSAEFSSLIQSVEENLLKSDVPADLIKKKLSLIKQIDAQSYTWQQDYFESFISPETGMPVVREVSSYSGLSAQNKAKVLNGLTNGGSDCSINLGEALANFKGQKGGDPSTTSWSNGEMGGNIEGLPGGLCLKGNNQAELFVGQYCGLKEKGNSVEIDVGWMKVGHVDELIKVVPSFPKKTPEECNFSIMLASPKKGLEILDNPENANKKFIDLSFLTEAEGDQKLRDIVNSAAGKELCKLVRGLSLPDKGPAGGDENKNVPKAKGAFFKNIIKNFLIEDLHAGVIVTEMSEAADCFKQLKEVTNQQMSDFMKSDEEFKIINDLVDEKMAKNREAIRAKLQERLPQCKDIKFVEVPDLFYGYGVAEVNGKQELPQPGNMLSLFPNPTNSVMANQTMIVSKSPNKAFDLFVKAELERQGVKSKFVDTWNYAHSGEGNMHCSSHSLTYCRPRGMK